MNSALAKYYQVLQLPVGASQRDIKKAYFKLAKLYHPDINSSAEAQKKFIEINEAYEILSNPQRLRELLYRYTTTAKQKAKRKKAQETKVSKKTTRRSKTSEKEFDRIVTKEVLWSDIDFIFKKIVAFTIFGTLSFGVSFISNLLDQASEIPNSSYYFYYLIFIVVMVLFQLFFSSFAYFDYLQLKKESKTHEK